MDFTGYQHIYSGGRRETAGDNYEHRLSPEYARDQQQTLWRKGKI